MNNLNLLLAEFMRAIPNIIGAILVLIVGYIVAKVVQSVVRGGLRRAGMDKFVSESSAGNMMSRVTKSPANVLGRVAYWLVFLGAISLAVSVLGIPALTAFVGAIYSYLPNVIAAILILLVALAVSAGVSGLVASLMGDTPTGKLVAGITPGIIFSIAIFMVLNQLRIAPAIVTITYAAIMGSVALGAALAFGLGGRGMAAQMLEQAQNKAQGELGQQARQDMATGAARGRDMATDAKQALENEGLAGQQGAGDIGFRPATEFGERVDTVQPERNVRGSREARPKDAKDLPVDGVIRTDDEV